MCRFLRRGGIFSVQNWETLWNRIKKSSQVGTWQNGMKYLAMYLKYLLRMEPWLGEYTWIWSNQAQLTCVGAPPSGNTVCCCFCLATQSLRPHGLQLATLLHPWDFPGNNTGVGCHFQPRDQTRVSRNSPALQADSWPLSHLGSWRTERCSGWLEWGGGGGIGY